MTTIENIHEAIFTNIYILSHIIYYIHPLIIITAFKIKPFGFLAIHYGDTRLNMIFFNLDFLLLMAKRFITSCLKR